MDNYDLIQRIITKYKDADYDVSLEYLEQYLSSKDAYVYDTLLSVYINCQIRLGLLDDAVKNLEILKKLYPKYSEYKLILKYIECGLMEKATELISNSDLSCEQHYKIAKKFFYYGNYDKAEKMFSFVVLNSDDDSMCENAQGFVDKINLYKNDSSVFRDVSYAYFMENGNTLCPGHIVYAKKLRLSYKENLDNTDDKKDKRPYMIWRIDGDKIYAFPVVKAAEDTKNYVLYQQNYGNCDFDRAIKDNLVCINKSDLERVKDKVSDEDFERIVRNLYYSICFSGQWQKQSIKLFMDDMIKKFNVNTNDIISVPSISDDSDVKLDYYFILDINQDKQKYSVIRMEKNEEDSFEIMDKMLTTINMNNPIVKIIRLDDNEKNKLLKQIPDNLKKEDLVGTIVEYDSKKIELMIEEENYYLGIDRTFKCSSSYFPVEFVKKDVPLYILSRVSQDDYNDHLNTLIQHLNNNNNEIFERKKEFIKRYK